jgi:thioredoxin domain-containing protein 5
MMKILVVAAVLAIVCITNAEIVELTDTDFDQKTSSGVWFVKYFAPWCGHCKALIPTWEELSKKVDSNINIAKVDCTKNQDICRRFQVMGYPTLILLKGIFD